MPKLFNLWNKDQTKDALCQSKLKGGAGLTIEQVLYFERCYTTKEEGIFKRRPVVLDTLCREEVVLDGVYYSI